MKAKYLLSVKCIHIMYIHSLIKLLYCSFTAWSGPACTPVSKFPGNADWSNGIRLKNKNKEDKGQFALPPPHPTPTPKQYGQNRKRVIWTTAELVYLLSPV